jgi:acetyl-CoA acyltransferase
MSEAVIVEAVRTPIGRRNGALSDRHPVELLAHTLNAAVERIGLDPERVDDVVGGCVSQTGEQGVNITRNAILAAGWPESVPGTTVDRQCGSSQQALHFAAQAIMAGSQDIVVACGVESMSRIPMTATVAQGPGFPFSPAIMRRYDNHMFNQGIGAEMIAERWGLAREDVDAFSLESHRRAAAARDDGRFAREIVPVGDVTADEGIRPDTSMEKLAGLKTAFKPDGVVTAGNSSQISDGASALVLMERATAERLGMPIRARIHEMAVVGSDPVIMLTGPIPATQKVLARARMTVGDIDFVEVNEAFAAVPLAWDREIGAGLEKVNVNGGAVALGHPLGASGARVMTTLLHVLEANGGRFGLQAICEGGGMANATIVERLS